MMSVDCASSIWFIPVPFKGDEKFCIRCPDHAPFSDHNALIKYFRFVHNVRPFFWCSFVEFKCLICSYTFELLKKANRHVAKIHPDYMRSVEESSRPSESSKKLLVEKKRNRSPLSDGCGQISLDFPEVDLIKLAVSDVIRGSSPLQKFWIQKKCTSQFLFNLL